MNTRYKSYFHGKNLKKTDGNVPTSGEPNSFIDVRSKETGKMKRRRKLGKDGFVIKDIDAPQGGVDHYHVHTFDKNGIRSKSHDNHASKEEEREMKKADRKRRTKI